MVTINILRQYPAGGHNEPLRYLAEQEGHEIRTHEYDLTSNVSSIGDNLQFLLKSLLWSRDERIILGAEPFDPLIPLFSRLAERHSVILHTSWPRWESDGDVPQPARFGYQHRKWGAFLKNVRAVGVTSAATASVAEAGASKAIQIPHAIDTSTFHPDADTDSVIEGDTPVILFVGQLERRKGVGELVDIITDWNGPDAEFWFVGDGPLSDSVSELAAESDRVRYFGYVSDQQQLATIYASADIFALPSYRVDGWEELFGIVLIEAFASGLPVVATDCVGPTEIIEDGKTGYIVTQHDTDTFASRIAELASSPGRRSEMGSQARKEALTQYDREIVAKKWRRILSL